MSEVRVTVQSASEAEERAVSAGTTAGALFADDRTVIAARVGGELKDLSYELAEGDVVEGVEISWRVRCRRTS